MSRGFVKIMSCRQPTQRSGGFASLAARIEHSVLLNGVFGHQIWEAAHGVPVSPNTPAKPHNLYDFPHLTIKGRTMERFLLLWDDMDDWLSAAMHLIGRRMA
jgi:hypothetical protein